MRSSLLGTVILTFAVAFAFAGIVYSNLSWVVAVIGLLSVFVYSHLRFSAEIRGTDLEVVRTVLDEVIMADEPVGIKVSVLNKTDSAVRGTFEDIIPPGCRISGGLNRTESVLPPRSILTMTYSITPLKRGTHDLPGVRIQRMDAFGLLVEDQTVRESTPILAHTSRESLQTARKMTGREHLEFSGVARSPAIVLRELEFDGIREYVPGDRARDIHWKTFPKLGKLMTKVYKKEGVLQTMIFVDAGRSMRLESYSVSKIDHAIDLAIQLSSVLLSSLHPAGVAAFDEVKVLEKVKPTLKRGQFDEIVETLRGVPGSFKAKEEPAERVERQSQQITPQRTADIRRGSDDGAAKFLSAIEDLSKTKKARGLGLGLDGAINEIIASSRGKEQLFIVITDFMSSKEAVIAGARICKRTGNRMFIIHTYDDWYRKQGDLSQEAEIERLYGNISGSLKVEGLMRALGASYIRIGPADTASGIVRATRRGRT